MRNYDFRQPRIAGRLKPQRNRPGMHHDIGEPRIEHHKRLEPCRNVGFAGDRLHHTLLGTAQNF